MGFHKILYGGEKFKKQTSEKNHVSLGVIKISNFSLRKPHGRLATPVMSNHHFEEFCCFTSEY